MFLCIQISMQRKRGCILFTIFYIINKYAIWHVFLAGQMKGKTGLMPRNADPLESFGR